jgi:hypothetical protein
MKVSHISPPADDPATTAPSNQPNLPSDEPSLVADLAVLIAEIEGATAGNTALDARIHFGFRVATRRSPDIAALLIETGITWPTVEAVLDEQIPPFSTSLDAALEGEDITFVIRSTKRRRWGAMQKARCGDEVLAWAATEPLARRLAAIRAWRVDLEKSAAAPKPQLETPVKNHDSSEGSVRDSDWEVMF